HGDGRGDVCLLVADKITRRLEVRRYRLDHSRSGLHIDHPRLRVGITVGGSGRRPAARQQRRCGQENYRGLPDCFVNYHPKNYVAFDVLVLELLCYFFMPLSRISAKFLAASSLDMLSTRL